MNTPKDRKYTKEHEWIMVENGVAKIGITDHAQDALGDIVFVEMPSLGENFASGDSIVTVESVKAVSNIITVVSGEIVEINEALDDNPELLNSDPYENFIVAIKVGEIDEIELIDADTYDAFVASEE
ncbi:MAG: glycine cleavage system protein GcvH [Clostridia bacterium]